MLPNVLCITYDSNLLEALHEITAGLATVFHAATAREAAQALQEVPCFSVVIAEKVLPDGSGITLLKETRERKAFASRVLVVRKPCDPVDVEQCLRVAAPFRLITVPLDVELLRQAVTDGIVLHDQQLAARRREAEMRRGIFEALQQVLAIASPEAYSRAYEISVLGMALHYVLSGRSSWELQTAAMLADLGLVALGPDIARSALAGQSLRAQHKELAERVPSFSTQILATMPHLALVRKIIAQTDPTWEDERLLEAHIIIVASAAVTMQTHNYPRAQILTYLRGKRRRYAQPVVDALPTAWEQIRAMGSRAISLVDATAGLVLQEDLKGSGDLLLLPRGTVLSDEIIHRVRGWSREKGEALAIRVYAEDCSPAEMCAKLCHDPDGLGHD
ncbi:MAG: hypothetical protein JXX28_16030 [Deltaproteobacteria bacterium]|nr:hypothetical protein [Deltaproteobacteria bacterium]